MPHHLPPVLKRFWTNWVRPFAVAAAIVLPFKSSLADWNWVPSGSMKPTIMEGDIVFVNKLAYDLKLPFTLLRLSAWSHPQKGDIVTFFSPVDGTRFVKRVVAGPGDTVEMRGNVLFINGRRLDYSWQDITAYRREIYEDPRPIIARESGSLPSHLVMALPSRSALRDFPALTIPEGKYFVMGDSRDNSHDSRFFGPIDRKLIVGRAQGVILSFNKNHLYLPRLDRLLSPLDS